MTRAMLVDLLADLLADALVADFKQYPTLADVPVPEEARSVTDLGRVRAKAEANQGTGSPALRVVAA